MVGLVVFGAVSERRNTDSKSDIISDKYKPIVTVAASDLFEAYDANEFTAQQAYGEHRLLVSGTIAGVAVDFMNQPVLQLKTSNQFMPVKASLEGASEAKLASLIEGAEISVLCGGIREVIGAPQLRDCEIAD